MNRIIFLLAVVLMANQSLQAGNKGDSSDAEAARQLKFIDSVRSAMHYETGTISLAGGMATLNVPSKFKFLNAAQSRYVLEDLWGNLPDEGVLGALFPADTDPFTQDSYVFIVSYDPMGYVKDDDVEDINYDDILKEMKEDQAEANKQRQAAGVSTLHLVGWAAKPFYDKEHKTLHWAKNLQVEGSEENTLNYTVMVLGRHGILHMNAVSLMGELKNVQASIPEVLQIPKFTEGNAYKDFDPKADKIAAWTIGGLVAGKVLAKAGLFVFLLKFWKLIALGFVALGVSIKKMISRKKQSKEPWPEDPAAADVAVAAPVETATVTTTEEEVKG